MVIYATGQRAGLAVGLLAIAQSPVKLVISIHHHVMLPSGKLYRPMTNWFEARVTTQPFLIATP